MARSKVICPLPLLNGIKVNPIPTTYDCHYVVEWTGEFARGLDLLQDRG